MKSVGIIGIGKYLPEKIMKNEDFVKKGLDTSDKWIVERTGIKERRIIADGMASSDMAVEASKAAIENAGIKPEDIDLIIVATSTSDYQVFPSTACIVQDKLGLRNIGAFDLSAACTGFNYALTTGSQYVKTGYAKNVLVVCSDCLSRFMDWEDRSVCILFGDGAGAVVLSEVQEGYGILTSALFSDGSVSDILKVEAGGSKTPFSQDVLDKKNQFISMDGKAVFKIAVNKIVPTILNELKKAGLKPEDIDVFIPHQANLRIMNYAREKLGLKTEQLIINIDKYGNTSAASIPLALSDAFEENKIKEGDIIVTAGFGAGFTWGVNIIRWGGKNA
jgi:3-oxoacyl-[acyl-carrier-protein] synthase III